MRSIFSEKVIYYIKKSEKEEYPEFKCILMKLGETEFDIGVPNQGWGEHNELLGYCGKDIGEKVDKPFHKIYD